MSENEEISTPPPPPASDPNILSAEEKQWAMFAHLSALLGILVTSVFGGWGSFIGPLIIWLVKKDTMPFTASHAKEALNFNIMVAAIFLIMSAFAVMTFGIGLLLTVPVSIVVGIVALVFTIIAALKANEGLNYRYPVNIRFIK